MSEMSWDFHDQRLPEMLLRLRARNWPESLSQQEWEAWQTDRKQHLGQPPGGDFYGLEAFMLDLNSAREEHRNHPDSLQLLDELEAWSMSLGLEGDISDL
jgi:exodeoxyribonuclease-1